MKLMSLGLPNWFKSSSMNSVTLVQVHTIFQTFLPSMRKSLSILLPSPLSMLQVIYPVLVAWSMNVFMPLSTGEMVLVTMTQWWQLLISCVRTTWARGCLSIPVLFIHPLMGWNIHALWCIGSLIQETCLVMPQACILLSQNILAMVSLLWVLSILTWSSGQHISYWSFINIQLYQNANAMSTHSTYFQHSTSIAILIIIHLKFLHSKIFCWSV